MITTLPRHAEFISASHPLSSQASVIPALGRKPEKKINIPSFADLPILYLLIFPTP